MLNQNEINLRTNGDKLGGNQDDDDDDKDDDDYCPKDDEQGHENDNATIRMTGKAECMSLPTCQLSHIKIKTVDEAFEQLFGYPFGTKFHAKRRKVGEKSDSDNAEKLICRVFGPSVAAKILATSHSVRNISIRRAPPPNQTVTVITEVKRYAGQTIRLQFPTSSTAHYTSVKTVQNNHQKDNSAVVEQLHQQQQPSQISKKPQGLDSLLQELEGPGKLSTVAKTSADWESFKQDSGATERVLLEQQAQGTNAYLMKQDFLHRVDHRSFLHEKAQRDRERGQQQRGRISKPS
jgi:Bucentaur or craniofacial development